MTIPNKFLAFRIHQEEKSVRPALEEITLGDLTEGEVIVKNSYSSINYKDALAATGAGKILRKFPLVGGVDVAGTVVESSDPTLKPGDKVLAACSGLSETNDGGYSEYSRLTSNAAIKIPENITPRTAMAIGTAGFAAALAIYKMGLNNQKPDLGPIAVTGATGGVGSIAIDMLSSLGYETVAITSKKDNEEYLKNIGATSVRFFDELDIGERPLERASFGGAIDNLGGNILSWLLRSTVEEGNVASIGLALNYKLDTNVMPFILRGVNLLGVNSTTLPKTTKETVWRKISEEMMPRNIDSIVTKELTLRDLSGSFQQYLDASVVGRVIVNIDGS